QCQRDACAASIIASSSSTVRLSRPSNPQVAWLAVLANERWHSGSVAVLTNADSTPSHPASYSPYTSFALSPRFSHLRCSRCTWVCTASCCSKRTSTSVATTASGLGCQVKTTRDGGSQTSTSPQSDSCPSCQRSKMRPPTRPSSTTRSTRSSPTEWPLLGHQ